MTGQTVSRKQSLVLGPWRPRRRPFTTLASLPYRFKGSSGANMAPTQTVHHHRSTTKTSHKPYKTKHASKSSLKDKEKGMSPGDSIHTFSRLKLH